MKTFTLLTIAGAAVLALTVFIGFEEPNGLLLLISAILMFAAPVAMFAHLALTDELSPVEKRIWLRALTGRRALVAFSVYLTCADRRAALDGLTPAPLPE